MAEAETITRQISRDKRMITIPFEQYDRLSKTAAEAIEENTAFKNRCAVILMRIQQAEDPDTPEVEIDPLIVEGMKRATAVFMGE